MDAKIVNFRRGRHTQTTSQMILLPGGSKSREDAQKLVGKSVSWESPSKKVINGKILAVHGTKGAVRAAFEKGLPGQALGTKIKIE